MEETCVYCGHVISQKDFEDGEAIESNEEYWHRTCYNACFEPVPEDLVPEDGPDDF